MKPFYLNSILTSTLGCSYLLAASCLETRLIASAEIASDGTLPTNVMQSGTSFDITGGGREGNNLFHSFREFSIPTGSEAFFHNDLTIENIISRVTGNSISQIDGSILANGNANLFLLNRNGIIFGPNAQLNIGGSFFATTASSISFVDGTQFTVINPQAQPLLTVSVPVGLQYEPNPGAIYVQGTGHNLISPSPFFTLIDRSSNNSGLQVQPEKTLALVGGDVILDGGTLTAEGGRIELGSVGEGTVRLNPTPGGFTLGYEGVQSFRNIQLSEKALADASGISSGSIQLQGSRVKLTDGSVILIQNRGVQPAGNISVNASESLEISGTASDGSIVSGLFNQTLRSGNGGDITVSTQRLLVQDGGVIDASTFSAATGGDVRVNASESVQVLGTSPLNSNASSNIGASTLRSGQAGNVSVFTRQLNILEGGSVTSLTFGTGDGGNVSVNASESVEVLELLAATTLSDGNAGNLEINTSRLVVRDGGRIDASTLAGGDAGSVTVNATESVEVSGEVPGSINPSLIISSANIVDEFIQQLIGLPPVPSGASGDVTINTPRLVVTDNAQVTVRNDGTGDAGNLMVKAGSIFLDNQGGLTAATTSGEGGNINLQVQHSLQMRHNSQISATAGGTGNGGNITIDTSTLAAFEDSDITANAVEGQGGNIQITAKGVFLSTDSQITASSQRGIEGIVQINTPDINLQSGLNQLEANFVTPDQVIANSCLAHRNIEQGSFVATGTGGIPYNPYGGMRGQYRVTDVQPIQAIDSAGKEEARILLKPPTSWELGDPIQEAQGLIVTADGRVMIGTTPQLVAIAEAKDMICHTDAKPVAVGMAPKQ